MPKSFTYTKPCTNRVSCAAQCARVYHTEVATKENRVPSFAETCQHIGDGFSTPTYHRAYDAGRMHSTPIVYQAKRAELKVMPEHITKRKSLWIEINNGAKESFEAKGMMLGVRFYYFALGHEKFARWQFSVTYNDTVYSADTLVELKAELFDTLLVAA